jgi:hypothetical protein
MMERMPSVGYPGVVGRFRPEQIAQQATWTVIPDNQRTQYAMSLIHVVPQGSSTVTYVNPVDPAYEGHYDKPAAWGTVSRAGIWR